ncbi:MAG TPA: hypothetical protein PKX00_03220 [Opitutaceae bacterium]|jgi:hypothetical protein|nr:hypothetical protein [Opitutaceae bacterium]
MTTSDQIKLFCIGLSVVLKHQPASSDASDAPLPHPSPDAVQDPVPAPSDEVRPAIAPQAH